MKNYDYTLLGREQLLLFTSYKPNLQTEFNLFNGITCPSWKVLGDRSERVFISCSDPKNRLESVSHALLKMGRKPVRNTGKGVPGSFLSEVHPGPLFHFIHPSDSGTGDRIRESSPRTCWCDREGLVLFRAAVHFVSNFLLTSAISYCKTEEGKVSTKTEAKRNMVRFMPPFTIHHCVCKYQQL